MGKLIIDGNSVFEIDEDCIKNRKFPLDCDIEKYLKEEQPQKELKNNKDLKSKVYYK